MTLDERAEKYVKDNLEGASLSFDEAKKRKQAYKDGFIQGEESKDAHWHTPEEIPTNEEGKSFTVNVLNNLHQIVYYSFSEGCWIDDTSCCDADEFEAWVYLPEYKG